MLPLKSVPPPNKPRVYTASKLDHADLWLHLVDEWPEIEFTARWPVDYLANFYKDAGIDGRQFWIIDEEDVRAADFVMVYGEPQDVLRGALVEAGMAIGLGRRVIVVGDNPFYGTWQYHPLVTRVESLEVARGMISTLHWREKPTDALPCVADLSKTVFDGLVSHGFVDWAGGRIESRCDPVKLQSLGSLIGVPPAIFSSAA